jgi:hypothetical protein
MLMRVFLAVATASGLLGGGLMALDASGHGQRLRPASYYGDQDVAALRPQRIIIGLDISKSNPLIEDREFAAKVGARIGGMVAKMGFASEVHVRTFGSYDASDNSFYYDTRLSTRARPSNVAAEIEKLISGVPLLVARGRFHPQDRTNILGFIDNTVSSLGCSGLPTTIVLASDGIEDSEYTRLERPDQHLPPPDGRPYRGCAELQILGIGQGTHSPRTTARLRHEWQGWALAAGFDRFVGLNDW